MSIVQATPPNSFGIPKTEFKKEYFDSAIWEKGYDVTIEKAFKCPCMTIDNSALPTCQNCLGTGYNFINPIKTKAFLHSINFSDHIKSWSEELLGTVSVTVRNVERLSFMDRITIINSAIIDNKVIFSEAKTIRGDIGNEFVFLSYRPIDIIGIYLFNNSTTKLILLTEDNYSISTANPYVINFNYDFSTILDFNGVCSVVFLHEITYHVLDLPHDIRNSFIVGYTGKEQQILMPINAIARKANNIMSLSNKNGLGLLDNSMVKNLWDI